MAIFRALSLEESRFMRKTVTHRQLKSTSIRETVKCHNDAIRPGSGQSS